MHPITYLLEDIYRNYWGIPSASSRPEGRLLIRWRARAPEPFVQPKRKLD